MEKHLSFNIASARTAEIAVSGPILAVKSFLTSYDLLEGGYVEGENGPEFITMDPLSELQAASVKNRVALGKRRGEWIRRIGALGISDPPELTGPLCASVAQFSLHANVYCAPNQRDKLEKLCRYVARPAVAEERLKLKSNGDVLLRLKKPFSDGTSHLVFSPLEFLEKLAALLPPPRAQERADTIIWIDLSFSRTLYQGFKRGLHRSVTKEKLWGHSLETFDLSPVFQSIHNVSTSRVFHSRPLSNLDCFINSEGDT
jgi:hypothetical protein